jgi:hypothetical protein
MVEGDFIGVGGEERLSLILRDSDITAECIIMGHGDGVWDGLKGRSSTLV